MAHALDRRDLLKGGAAAAALVGAGVIAPQPARATEADAQQTWGVFDEEGMFTPSFLIAPDPIPASDIVDVTETDIVVVGMGLAGMSAARAAIEEGARVVVVEKGNEHHTHSHQFHAINCQAAKDMGAELTQEQIDLLVDSEIVGNFHERVDRRLWEYLLNHCGEDFDWYLSLTDHYTVVNPNETVAETELDAEALMNICTAGLGFIVGRGFPEVSAEREQAVRDAGPYICIFNHPLNPEFDLASERFPMSPGVVTVEPDHSVLGNNVAAFIEANADVRYASWCRRILREGEGRVTGIVYEDIDGAFHQVNAAKGVILCSGDFAGNKAMVNYFQDCHRLIQGGDLGWVDVDAKGERTNLGEGLSMAHWIGAKVDNTHACCNDHYGGALGCDPMLFVDGSGQRFMNEDVTGEILGEKVNRVPGQVIWQVFDSNYPEQISHMPVGHRCYWKVAETYDEIPMGLFLDPIGMITRSEVEGWPGLVAPADTLEELAANMGVPADAFVATVERYNELYDKGVDEDFGKRADRLTEVRTPPFYAAQMRPLGYQTFYGSVCCDEATHAVDEQNNAIPGLYVAGTVMGSRFWNVYPNTAMGVNHAGALCYGRLAGINAARGV